MNDMSKLEDKPKKREDIESQVLGDEIMLYDSVNEKIHVLNHTAYFIWQLCDGNHSLQDINKSMNSHFPEKSNLVILNDLKQTINDFCHKKLLIK
jgi:RecG-like helicase